MRYAPGHNEATRERIIEVAARLFREAGIAAVGLAKVMTEADLTVGTFYTHFKSKEALLREALQHALRLRHAELEQALSEGNLEGAVRAYLSREHRDAPGAGCAAAALAPEVARHPRASRQAFVTGLTPSVELIRAALSEQRAAVSVAEATAFFGLLAGTLQLARATPDRAESDAILEAGAEAALRLAQPAPAASSLPRPRARRPR